MPKTREYRQMVCVRGPAELDGAAARENWRMPSLAVLAPVQMSVARRVGMSAMWIYLAVTIAMVIVRVVELAIGR